jgi:Zn-dependent peptidase ImmA (M78 family)
VRSRVDPRIPRRVDEVLTRSGAPRLPNGIGIDVRRILERFSRLNVKFVRGLNPGGRRLLAAYVPQFRCVFVEKDCIEARQRFSMAHELGHVELEDDFGDADSLFKTTEAFLCFEADTVTAAAGERTAGLRRRRETRANQFAALLLMPEYLVKEVWRNVGEVRRGADLLGVSKESLRYRLAGLGLIDESG